MQEHDFSALIEKIVTEQFPSELLVYELSGKELIREAYAERPIKATHTKGEINFLEEGKEIIAFGIINWFHL